MASKKMRVRVFGIDLGESQPISIDSSTKVTSLVNTYCAKIQKSREKHLYAMYEFQASGIRKLFGPDKIYEVVSKYPKVRPRLVVIKKSEYNKLVELHKQKFKAKAQEVQRGPDDSDIPKPEKTEDSLGKSMGTADDAPVKELTKTEMAVSVSTEPVSEEKVDAAPVAEKASSPAKDIGLSEIGDGAQAKNLEEGAELKKQEEIEKNAISNEEELRRKEEEAERKKQEDLEKQRTAEEAERKRQEELEKQKLAEEAELKRQEELEKRRIAEEADRKRQEEEEESKRQEELEKQRIAKEAELKRQEELEKKRIAEETDRKRQEEEEESKRQEELEKQRIAEEAERKLQEEEAERKRQEELEKQRIAEEADRKRQEEEEERKRQEELEKQRIAEEAERKLQEEEAERKRQEELEKQRIAEEVERKRQEEEAELKRQEELEKQRIAEEAERKLQEEEAERKRQEELEKQRIAEEADRKRQEEEEERKRQEELEKQRIAEEAERKLQEEEAERKRQEELEKQQIAEEAERKRQEEYHKQQLATEQEQKEEPQVEAQPLVFSEEATSTKISSGSDDGVTESTEQDKVADDDLERLAKEETQDSGVPDDAIQKAKMEWAEMLKREEAESKKREEEAEEKRKAKEERRRLRKLEKKRLKEEKQKKREQEKQRAEEAELKLKEEEELEKKRIGEEAELKRQEEEAELKKQQEAEKQREAELKLKEEEELKRKEDIEKQRIAEEAELKQQEEEAELKKQQEAEKQREAELKLKEAEELEKQRIAEEAELKRQEEEAELKRKEEIEKQRLAEEAELKRQEEEAELKRKEELEKQRIAEEVELKRQEEEAELKRKEELEKQRLAEEAELKQQEEEAELKRKEELEKQRIAEEAELKQQEEEAEIKRKEDLEKQRLAEEAELKQQEEEAEIKRKEDLEKQRLAEEAELKQQEEEAELKRKEELEKQRIAEEVELKQQEEEAELKLKEEEELKRKEDIEKQRIAEEAELKRQEELEKQRIAEEEELKLQEEETERRRQEDLEKQRHTEETERIRLEELEKLRVAEEAELQRQEELEKQRVAEEAELKRQDEEAELKRKEELENKQLAEETELELQEEEAELEPEEVEEVLPQQEVGEAEAEVEQAELGEEGEEGEEGEPDQSQEAVEQVEDMAEDDSNRSAEEAEVFDGEKRIQEVEEKMRSMAKEDLNEALVSFTMEDGEVIEIICDEGMGTEKVKDILFQICLERERLLDRDMQELYLVIDGKPMTQILDDEILLDVWKREFRPPEARKRGEFQVPTMFYFINHNPHRDIWPERKEFIKSLPALPASSFDPYAVEKCREAVTRIRTANKQAMPPSMQMVLAMTRTKQHLQILQMLNLSRTIVDILREPGHPSIIKERCVKLAIELCIFKDERDSFSKNPWLAVFLSTFDGETSEELRDVCFRLWLTILQHGSVPKSFWDIPFVELLLANTTKNAHKLLSLLLLNSEFRKKCIAAGFDEALLGLFQKSFHEDGRVKNGERLAALCEAYTTIAHNEKRLISAFNGLGLQARLMQFLKDNASEEIARGILHIFRIIVIEEDHAIEMLELGLSKCINEIADVHRGNVEVTRTLCNILSIISRHNSCNERLFTEGGMQVVLMALRERLSDVSVARSCAICITNLSLRKERRRSLLAFDFETAFTLILESQATNPIILEISLIGMLALAGKEEKADSTFKRSGCVSFLTMLLTTYSNRVFFLTLALNMIGRYLPGTGLPDAGAMLHELFRTSHALLKKYSSGPLYVLSSLVYVFSRLLEVEIFAGIKVERVLCAIQPLMDSNAIATKEEQPLDFHFYGAQCFLAVSLSEDALDALLESDHISFINETLATFMRTFDSSRLDCIDTLMVMLHTLRNLSLLPDAAEALVESDIVVSIFQLLSIAVSDCRNDDSRAEALTRYERLLSSLLRTFSCLLLSSNEIKERALQIGVVDISLSIVALTGDILCEEIVVITAEAVRLLVELSYRFTMGKEAVLDHFAMLARILRVLSFQEQDSKEFERLLAYAIILLRNVMVLGEAKLSFGENDIHQLLLAALKNNISSELVVLQGIGVIGNVIGMEDNIQLLISGGVLEVLLKILHLSGKKGMKEILGLILNVLDPFSYPILTRGVSYSIGYRLHKISSTEPFAFEASTTVEFGEENAMKIKKRKETVRNLQEMTAKNKKPKLELGSPELDAAVGDPELSTSQPEWALSAKLITLDKARTMKGSFPSTPTYEISNVGEDGHKLSEEEKRIQHTMMKFEHGTTHSLPPVLQLLIILSKKEKNLRQLIDKGIARLLVRALSTEALRPILVDRLLHVMRNVAVFEVEAFSDNIREAASLLCFALRTHGRHKSLCTNAFIILWRILETNYSGTIEVFLTPMSNLDAFLEALSRHGGHLETVVALFEMMGYLLRNPDALEHVTNSPHFAEAINRVLESGDLGEVPVIRSVCGVYAALASHHNPQLMVDYQIIEFVASSLESYVSVIPVLSAVLSIVMVISEDENGCRSMPQELIETLMSALRSRSSNVSILGKLMSAFTNMIEADEEITKIFVDEMDIVKTLNEILISYEGNQEVELWIVKYFRNLARAYPDYRGLISKTMVAKKMVEIVREYGEDIELTRVSLDAIRYLTDSKDYRGTLLGEGIVDLTIDVLQRHAGSGEVIVIASEMLSIILKDDIDSRKEIMNGGGVNLLLGTTRRHKFDASIAKMPLHAVALVAELSSQTQHAIVELDGVETAMELLRLHRKSEDKDITINSLMLLKSVSLSNEGKSRMNNDKGIELVIELAEDFLDNADILVHILLTIKNVCLTASFNEKISETTIFDSLKSIMTRHKDNEMVIEASLALLKGVSVNNTNSEIVGKKEGLIDAIIRALENIHSESLLELGCKALFDLSYNNSFNKLEIASCGGLHVVLQALEEFPMSRGICIEGVKAIRNITQEERNKSLIGELDGVDLLVSILKRHIRDSQVVEQVLRALKTLIVNAKCSKDILKRENQDVIFESLSANRDAGIQRLAQFFKH